MLLAEDLLLLVTDDATGRLSVSREPVDAGLGGANLAELTLRGQVDVSGDQDPGRRGRIIVRDPSPPGDEVLDAALQTLVKRQGRKPSAVIRPLGKKLRRVLYQRLAARGVLRAGRRRVLGIFPRRTWPAQDPSRKAEVRQQVTQALAGTAAPDERTAALIALLHALKCEHKVVDPRSCQLSRRQLRKRAAKIAQGNWASSAPWSAATRGPDECDSRAAWRSAHGQRHRRRTSGPALPATARPHNGRTRPHYPSGTPPA